MITPEPDQETWDATAMLATMVRVWAARGRLGALDKYLAGRKFTTPDRPGRNPLGGLKPFAEFHRVVIDCADSIRFPNVARTRQERREVAHG
jgi:hypothetical protein